MNDNHREVQASLGHVLVNAGELTGCVESALTTQNAAVLESDVADALSWAKKLVLDLEGAQLAIQRIHAAEGSRR